MDDKHIEAHFTGKVLLAVRPRRGGDDDIIGS